MEILKKLFLLPILLLYSCLAFSQNGLLSGKIVDSKTKSPLAGAYLHVKGYNKVVSAGNEGEYAILLPLDTSFMIQATYIGYTPCDFQVCLASDSTINILMDSSNELSKVYVYGEKNDFGAKSAQMSAISVPIEQIKGVPALFGEVDVMKVLQKLPGVQSMGDGASNIYVRGGNYDQNLITLDGSTLYNSEHLKGFVSAVNSDIINNLLLYKGGFPARYGARISSVVDIGVKEGNFKKLVEVLELECLHQRFM
ncbi:MAG: TonB-dependent receptor plug domain-containing protein [Bacteroidales bacterium]|nr:TonB-dependent receptor plug domain-containing protein [Bacteroidales bacterium]